MSGIDEPNGVDHGGEKDETDFHSSPPLEGLDDRTLVWLAQTDTSLATVAKVARIRAENPAAYAGLIDAVSDTTKAKIVRFLCFHRTGTTYSELTDVVAVKTERTVRTKVSEMADDGVLSVGDGRPASIDFRDDDVRLLANDMLSNVS